MRKIVITSGKGGVGKTTATATLGRKLALRGYKVVLVDADVGLNNLDVVMAVDSRVVFDVNDVMRGRCSVIDALVTDSSSGAKVLPSATDGETLTAQSFRNVVDELRGFDFVLIDCPAGIEHGFHRAVSAAEEALVVTTPSVSSIRDADKVISLLKSYTLHEINLVVNRVRFDMVSKGEMMSPEEIGRLLHVVPSGAIPEDDCITVYQQLGAVPDFAISDRAYETLANNIVNHTQKAVQYPQRKFFSFRKIRTLQ